MTGTATCSARCSAAPTSSASSCRSPRRRPASPARSARIRRVIARAAAAEVAAGDTILINHGEVALFLAEELRTRDATSPSSPTRSTCWSGSPAGPASRSS